MRSNEFVKESLTSALPYQQVVGKFNPVDDPMLRQYRFNIDNIEYTVKFLRDSGEEGKHYELDFTAKTPKGVYYNKTGTGHQQQVFASVINILRDFLVKKQPDSITFSADKDEESRVRLYMALMRKFRNELQQLGYKIGTSGKDYDYATFKIEKINKEPESVNELKKYAHTGQGYRDRFPSVMDREEWRGPHEGKELDMMLDNTKPAALITSISWPLFKPYIRQGRFISRPMQGRMKGFYLVAQPNEKWRLNKIEQIMMNFDNERDSLDVYHAKLGRLLGYDKEHIKKFIGFI
jgi:hypothetical protein